MNGQQLDDTDRAIIELLQADGKRDLAGIFKTGNPGDAGDLFPHGNKRTLGKGTKPGTHFSDGKWSGVTLRVNGRAGDAISASAGWRASAKARAAR